MHIGIDAIAANEELRTGPGVYAFELLRAMMAATGGDRVSLYLNKPLVQAWADIPPNWQARVLPWKLPGWATVRLSSELLWHPPDVLFAPSSRLPLWTPRGGLHKTAATIQDIGFMRFPELYERRDRQRQKSALRRALRRADLLLTISAFTKQELVELFRVPAEKIVVIPLAVSPRFTPDPAEAIERMRVKARISQHYLLCVSRLDRKKNIETLIRGFEIFKSQRGFGDPHELVIVGPDGFGAKDIRARIATSSIRSSIHLLGGVSEEEKVALYSGALGYVNISWYEGFGLTPLEAAACGTAALLSDIPAHREVMGDGALYANPRDPEVFALALKHFAEEPTRREAVLARARERLILYSWERTAALTWEALRGVVAPKNLFHTF
ncbi:glycosyltransferase family 4 protein [Candidatus Uhrbacteria bacterium]|nr:glycosyltransferase family 4 protein [Candidatus Uhrbacteria bacterium]